MAYIPDIGSLVTNTASKLLSAPDSLAAEDVPLFLPSSISPNLRSTPGFLKTLAHESWLRIAQADDALADIRHHLRIISGLWQFKRSILVELGTSQTLACALYLTALTIA